MRATLGTSFFQRALLEAMLVGALCGSVGVHVLLRRLSFFVVATSHATFPGVVIAGAFGVSLLAGGFLAGLVFVALVVLLGRRAVGETTVTGVLLAGTFALGVVVASARQSGARDLTAYLVGSVLSVTTGDIGATLVVALVVIAGLTLTHKELVLAAFDPDGATALGYRPRVLDAAVMVAVLATMVVAIPAVGTLLVLALLVVPALTARLVTDRAAPALLVGALVGALSAAAGMLVTAAWPVAAGAAMALASGAVLGVTAIAVAVRPVGSTA